MDGAFLSDVPAEALAVDRLVALVDDRLGPQAEPTEAVRVAMGQLWAASYGHEPLAVRTAAVLCDWFGVQLAALFDEEASVL